jgi:hypothetical protein
MSDAAHGDRHESAERAGPSLARHLARGALGFGLIGLALALSTRAGPAALLLAPAGLVALRGCPACWIAGLIETISAGRLRRSCGADGCGLRAATPARGTEALCPPAAAAAPARANARRAVR